MKVVLCLLLALLGIANGHGYGGGHGGWGWGGWGRGGCDSTFETRHHTNITSLEKKLSFQTSILFYFIVTPFI
jgi:hypothetical protein